MQKAHEHQCPHCDVRFICENNCQKPERYACHACASAAPALKVCAECGSQKVFVKYLNDDGVFVWLCLEDAAAKGNPVAVQVQTMRWIEGRLQPAINVKGVM